MTHLINKETRVKKYSRNTTINTLKKHKARFHELLLLSLLALPGASHAATIESILQKGANYLQGTLARAVGVIVIISCGYLCLYKQRLPKEQFVMVLVGLGIILGGSTLYTTLTG